jgi:hypothetical protein
MTGFDCPSDNSLSRNANDLFCVGERKFADVRTTFTPPKTESFRNHFSANPPNNQSK